MPIDVEYTRKYAVCRNVASTGSCVRAPCSYSHTLVDTARVVALVGDVPSSAIAHTTEPGNEKTLFLIECTKYAQPQADAADASPAVWRMRLGGGGGATLAVGAAGETISVQPVYPVKGQGAEAAAALVALEGKVFGRSPQVSVAFHRACWEFRRGERGSPWLYRGGVGTSACFTL